MYRYFLIPLLLGAFVPPAGAQKNVIKMGTLASDGSPWHQIEKALAIDPGKKPDSRLVNLVAQQRARWLLGRVDELFLEPAAPAKP